MKPGKGDRRLAAVVTHAGRFDRAARFGIDVAGPGDQGVLLGRQEFAGRAVEDVEEAVLGRLHDDLALSAPNLQVGQDHVLRGGEVPGLSRGLLVMPDVFPGIRPQGHDRRQEQVVAAAGAANLRVPGRTVADPDVQQVEFRVVGHGIPHGSAAAELPPLAGPGLRRHLQDRVFKRLRGIAGHGVETPRHFAGRRIVGRNVAAHAELGAAVADDHFALDHARGAGDAVGTALGYGADLPGYAAVGSVERDQSPVQRADEDLALPGGHAAIDRIAAELQQFLAGHLRVVLPQQFAGDRVEGVDHAPGATDVEDAVDHQRRCLHAAVGRYVEIPAQAKPFRRCCR